MFQQLKNKGVITRPADANGNAAINIIGAGTVIEGEIKAQNAVIEGQFRGSIFIEDLLHIKETANVEGEINTDKLSVAPGAKFNVVSKMSSQISARPSTPVPKNENNLN